MKIIIYSFAYNDDSGGTVVLQKLCHLLNENGYNAALWPMKKPVFYKEKPISSLYKFLIYFKKKIRGRFRFARRKDWNTPIATWSDLNDENVVIYPEVTDGNPLRMKNVVRWLLHIPGYYTGRVEYGKDDLIFYYAKAYLNGFKELDSSYELYIPNYREDTYYQKNFGKREGSCYILRKGKNKKIVHDLTNSILIDGKSHQEIAEIFNKVEYCISYDAYTMYSIYAVMCGCKSVIIPDEGISKEEWQPDEKQRYGLAYGFDDLEYAQKTRDLLLKQIKIENEKVPKALENFINKCRIKFNL